MEGEIRADGSVVDRWDAGESGGRRDGEREWSRVVAEHGRGVPARVLGFHNWNIQPRRCGDIATYAAISEMTAGPAPAPLWIPRGFAAAALNSKRDHASLHSVVILAIPRNSFTYPIFPSLTPPTHIHIRRLNFTSNGWGHTGSCRLCWEAMLIFPLQHAHETP